MARRERTCCDMTGQIQLESVGSKRGTEDIRFFLDMVFQDRGLGGESSAECWSVTDVGEGSRSNVCFVDLRVKWE